MSIVVKKGKIFLKLGLFLKMLNFGDVLEDKGFWTHLNNYKITDKFLERIIFHVCRLERSAGET